MRCIACNRKLDQEELAFNEDPPLCILYGCSELADVDYDTDDEGDDL